MAKPVRKRCAVCGHQVVTSDRRCKQVDDHAGRFRRQFYCWGRLVRVQASGSYDRQAAQQAADASAAASPKPKPRPQDVAAKKQAAAEARVSQWIQQVAKAGRMLKRWQARASYYARRAAMTDAQVEAERAARKAQAENRTPKRRAIDLKGQIARLKEQR